MDRDAAAQRDVADDLIPRHGAAAFRETHHHVVDPLDLDPEPRGGARRPCTLDLAAREALGRAFLGDGLAQERDRKSTRLNSSHANISYAVFCLKKKKATTDNSWYHR